LSINPSHRLFSLLTEATTNMADFSKSISDIKREQETFKSMSCTELLAYLDHNWDTLPDGRRAYLTFLMAGKGCREAVPYLLRQVESDDPFHRWRALSGLADLGCQEHHQVFVDFHLNDPSEDVRRKALVNLCHVFRGECDTEILQLALAAWDDPASSVGMRLAAGAVMMYQLNVPHDERGGPGWWNEEREDLQHPSILQAVEETRRLLAQEAPVDPSVV